MSDSLPPGPVGADLELSRERAFGNLAVDRGPGQPRSGRATSSGGRYGLGLRGYAASLLAVADGL